MPIDEQIYDDIKEITKLPILKIWYEFGNPLIEFDFKYIRNSHGNEQSYSTHMRPNTILDVLHGLNSRGLITESQFKKFKEDVKKLEEELNQNKQYKAHLAYSPKI